MATDHFQTIRLTYTDGQFGPKDAPGKIATITLDRPEVRNAIDQQMIDELGAALQDILDQEARAVVLTGSSEKAFAAGADIAQLKERGVPAAMRRINAGLFQRIEDLPIPSVAAVKGWALGGGCELAMACDLRVAGEGARFGQPEVGLGIIAGAGAIQRLPRLVGFGRAKELLLTGRIIKADEAERIGLVNRVVPDDQVVDVATEIATQIANQGALAVQITKQALNASFGPDRSYQTLDVFGQAVLFETEDKHDRMAAFLERKAARKKAKENNQ